MDRGPLTRDQQYKLQFGVAESMRLAARSGRTGAATAHNGTRLEARCIKVFCTKESGQFYKQVINTIKVQGLPELESFYLRRISYRAYYIYAQIPREGMGLIPNIVEHFCTGT